MMQVSFGDQPLSDGVGSGLAFPKAGGWGHPGVRAAPSAPAGLPPGFDEVPPQGTILKPGNELPRSHL